MVKFPDPDPAKRSRSDRIRIRIRNTAHKYRQSPCSNMAYVSLIMTPCLKLYGGLYFGPKTISPPPLLKIIFFPLSGHVIFRLPSRPFCLNSSLFCIYFTLLPLLLSFSYPFLCFYFIFPPFSLRLFIYFPPNYIG